MMLYGMDSMSSGETADRLGSALSDPSPRFSTSPRVWCRTLLMSLA